MSDEVSTVRCGLCNKEVTGSVQYNHWRTKPEPSVFMMVAYCEPCGMQMTWPSNVPYDEELIDK